MRRTSSCRSTGSAINAIVEAIMHTASTKNMFESHRQWLFRFTHIARVRTALHGLDHLIHPEGRDADAHHDDPPRAAAAPLPPLRLPPGQGSQKPVERVFETVRCSQAVTSTGISCWAVDERYGYGVVASRVRRERPCLPGPFSLTALVLCSNAFGCVASPPSAVGPTSGAS